MGKMLKHQRRGKGSSVYRTPSHRYYSKVKYPRFQKSFDGEVLGFVDDPGHGVLIALIELDDGSEFLNLASEGLAMGARVKVLKNDKPRVGDVSKLRNLPEGTPVFNVEANPGDGGQFARATGASAMLLAQDEDTGLYNVRLASKAIKKLSPDCFATVGVACGGGRTEKPFKKASARRFAMKATHRIYPRVRGTAMNANNHPHGGKSMGKPSTVSRHAPPGQKVGHIAARRTGRRKGKKSSDMNG
ncbi:MAG: 50S ribosomal protein L2 [Candidatus Micrarchaeota archaeon]